MACFNSNNKCCLNKVQTSEKFTFKKTITFHWKVLKMLGWLIFSSLVLNLQFQLKKTKLKRSQVIFRFNSRLNQRLTLCCEKKKKETVYLAHSPIFLSISHKISPLKPDLDRPINLDFCPNLTRQYFLADVLAETDKSTAGGEVKPACGHQWKRNYLSIKYSLSPK